MTDQELGGKFFEVMQEIARVEAPFVTSPNRGEAEAAVGRFLRAFAGEVAREVLYAPQGETFR